jgi:hypothetical protein
LDAVAILALTALGVAAEWDRLTGPAWIGMDTATAFFPWYTFLGEQLRAGLIPTWNPHVFSGAPFAADPESGWMYLPVMLAFTWLPLDAAARAHLLLHILLAAISTYAFARQLGCNVFGGLVAGTAYAHSGFFEGHNVCCYAYADVAAWLPLMLFGAERAVRSLALRSRAVWWGVTGFALSQVLAAWIGQGAYYALLVLVSYIAYRTLLIGAGGFRQRLVSFARNSLGTLLFGFALAAAGVLPRLEYNLVSNLPGGYPHAEVSLRVMAWNDWAFVHDWDRLLLQPGFEYIGWPVLILALAAPLQLVPAWKLTTLRHRQLTVIPYFLGLGLAVLILARAEQTPLHALLSFLPGFERIHARSPERILIVFYLAPSVLAGVGLTWLTRSRNWRLGSQLIGVAALVVVAADLHLAWTTQAAESLAGDGDYQFARIDLASYYAPTPGADFLIAAQASGPFRYFGYAGHVFGGPMPYTLRWAYSAITALQVNNRALVTGLDDIEGYNPVHLARYDDFVVALNGNVQNYHHADIFDSGFDSPLLDLLNVRYVIMPTDPASDEVEPNFTRPLQIAYADSTVKILENSTAAPRAWIVHSTHQVPPSESAAALVNDSFDLRQVAILEVPPPPVALPADANTESVQIVVNGPDRIQLRASAAAPGILVASEVYYPAWHAYLDNEPVPLYVVDHALRGVGVPAGEHIVEMRYESPALAAGLIISAAAALLLIALAILHIAALTARSRDESGEVRCKAGAVPQL